MKARRVVTTLLIVVVAVALQTTLFARIRPFDAAPALVLLVVIAYARHLPAEIALLFGFGAGLLEDLLSDSALGLWAFVMTSVAFVVVRARHRLEEDFGLLASLVFAVTAGGLALFSVLGTIFGEKTLADVGIIKKVLLPAVYNTVLAAVILPFATWALGVARRRDAPFRL